jgi:type IV pilus assembly protein PilC
MDYSYIAYADDRRLVRGKVSASSEEAAIKLLSYSGYQVLNLKKRASFFNLEAIGLTGGKPKANEVVLFARQMALLLDSGTDIVTALELLQEQSTNRTLKRVLGEVANDIRGGSSLSLAMSRHPKVFNQVFHRAVAAGEQGGNLEVVLRNMADFMERIIRTEKKIRSALTYPVIVFIVAIIVVGILVTFVLPTFTDLYRSLGTDLPTLTQVLINVTDWLTEWGLYLFGGILVLVILAFLYTRSKPGKYQLDKMVLKLPVIGRIINLSELSRAAQTISLLFRAGLPLPEILTQTVNSSGNMILAEALTGVQRELIRGEGLSKPMKKRPIFLPLLVQMVSVGEETGKLDDTLQTVVTTYEVEADDRISAAVGLIQPLMIIVIGIIVGLLAVALVSAMYSLYGGIR